MLTFPMRTSGRVPSYSAAELVSIKFDYGSKRVIVEVRYGLIDLGTFIKSSEIPNKMYVLDGQFWDSLMNSGAFDRQVENRIWAALQSADKETGTVV